MPYSLKGRNVLITGGSRGLGALVAEKFAAEGSHIAINYVSNEARARETAEKLEKQFGAKVTVIQADVGIQAECVRLVKETIAQLGGLDIVISNAGWTKITRFADLDAMNEEEWDKCWSTNVKANLHIFREAAPTFNANPDGGSFIITASTAGVVAGGSSMAYSVSKAAALHLMKSLAGTQGPKIRTNAVLPGLLLTEWGERFPKEVVDAYEQKVPLNHVPDLGDCAEMFISLAKNTSMTGQSIQVDSGFAMR
ncbi:hypothetical protein FQN53_005966 [Emmonsiellopsis sp. PD_33]|nr:hypothetical protein FQN53_005966 [Emmonsiellopsis sp. PD_33]